MGKPPYIHIDDGDLKEKSFDITEESIRDLSDFQDVDYADDQVPTWNDAESRFEPGDGGGGGASQEDVDLNESRIILNAFDIAVNGSLSQHGMIQGRVDEYEDEDGIDTSASSGQTYNSDGYYSNVAHDVPYDEVKELKVTSASDSPTISRTVPIKLTSGDETTSGTDEVPLDWTDISSEEDIGIYDENDNLLDYYIESFDASEEIAVIHVYRDWVRDGSVQAKVTYGNGPSDQSVAASTVFDKESGLEAGYLLNEGSGDARDVTSNNHDGTVSGATQGEDGIVDGGYEFDGDDDYVDMGDLGLTTSDDFSFGCWVNADDMNNEGRVLILKRELDTDIRVNDDKVKFGIYDGSTFVQATSDTLSSGVDYYVMATYDNSSESMTLFVNGADVDTQSNPIASKNTNSQIGAEAGAEFHFQGLIDDVRIYTSVLSSVEIAAVYDATKESPDFFEHQAAESVERNITLISTDYTAETEPNTGRLILREEDIDTVTLNTDLLAYLSKDGGSTWDELTLEELDVFDDIRILEGEVSLSSSGTDMAYKIETANDKMLRIHSASDTWD